MGCQNNTPKKIKICQRLKRHPIGQMCLSIITIRIGRLPCLLMGFIKTTPIMDILKLLGLRKGIKLPDFREAADIIIESGQELPEDATVQEIMDMAEEINNTK